MIIIAAMNRLLLILLMLTFSAPAIAADDMFRSTEYPLPRFVSVSSSKAYVRTGPDKKYPVKWIYTQKGLPVEIILEFEHWRKIRDIDGSEGWVHHSLLSGKRSAIVVPKVGYGDDSITIYRKPKEGARAVAKLGKDVVVSLEECGIKYCDISANGFKGWVDRGHLWGVYPKEIIED